MIKKMTMLALTVCTLCATEAQAQIKLGGKTLNAQKLVQAGADMISRHAFRCRHSGPQPRGGRMDG